MSKARKRRLSTNKPFIFVIIITLIMMFAYFLIAQAFIGMGIAIPVVMITEGSFDQQKILDLSSLFSIFGGFIVLIFYYFWYRPEYKWKRNKNEAWKFTISNAFVNSALGIIKAQQIAAMITVISNVLPAILGAVSEQDNEDHGGETEPEQTAVEGEGRTI